MGRRFTSASWPRLTAYVNSGLVQDIGSGRYKTGRASEEWVLSKSSGTLKMISEKETVHSDPIDRRRNNRQIVGVYCALEIHAWKI
jgi:hypothetical protein